jgi:cysteine desulfurase/selenocysteine lyase
MKTFPSSVGVHAIREDFPILSQQVHGNPLIYFDNAATTQKPRQVIAALSDYYQTDNANVHRGIHELSHRATVAFEGARERVAEFIHASDSHEIVFTRGTTEAINLLARSWGDAFIGEGDTILLTEMEHHSNLVPWQLLAERKKAKLEFLPITGDEGLLDLAQLDRFLDDTTVKLLAFTHISNTLGVINPVAGLCARARAKGITTFVDAAQSAGHGPLDVQALGCDFLAFSGHKMCGPTGIGVLWGRKELLDAMPPYHGGGEMILSVDYRRSTYKKAPYRFEAGTPPIAQAIGLAAAMDYIDSVGRPHILEHVHSLADHAARGLGQIPGIRLFGPSVERAGIVSFHFDDVHAHDIVTFADQKGLALRGGHHCTQPLMKLLGVASTARASFYFYNTPEEVERLVEVVTELHGFFSA